MPTSPWVVLISPAASISGQVLLHTGVRIVLKRTNTQLLDGDRNKNISETIFKAKGKTLDIKLQKKWKYDDKLCSGCYENEESGEEILSCKSF